jgi:hypothetical protein
LAEQKVAIPCLFSGNVGFCPESFLKSVKISYEDNFKLAEELLV